MKDKKNEIRKEFWEAHEEAFFGRQAVCIILNMSMGWLELQGCNGNKEGPPFYKVGRKCLYKKKELLQWILDREKH